MSMRGVKFAFEEDEKVLCFEPDPSKARVLYDAKVLEVTTRKRSNGQKGPGYLVHFSGWNSSWDRVVKEDFILKNTEDNRKLMKRLAAIARQIRKNRVRKKRIDEILRQVLKRRPRYDSEEETSEEDECEDVGEEEETTGEEEEDTEREEGEDSTQESGSEDESTVEGGETEDNPQPEEIAVTEVELEIPDPLKSQLENDFHFINRKKKLVHLPAEPNVVSLLESYVKNYAINLLCSTPHKAARHGHTECVNLCKEVVEGLRICFDFTLPTILLYNLEREQYEKVVNNYKPLMSTKKEKTECQKLAPLHSPTRCTRSGRGSVPNSPSFHESPPSKVAKFTALEKEKEKEHFNVKQEKDVPTPRRLTRGRLNAADATRLSGDSNKSEKMPDLTLEDKGVTEPKRRGSLRSSHRVAALSEAETVPVGRATPPPPLLIPNSISTNASSSSSSGSGSSKLKHAGGRKTPPDREAVLNEVLTWKLVPPEIFTQTPVAPSAVYGAHHLLRLFVKLPDLLCKMGIPERKMNVLLKHLGLFLDYMNAKREEFFPHCVYVDEDTSSNTRNTSKR
ncbi:male-specific lethal 3 homolog isoform X2 [Lingula anatina]|uniref:Male-specific lethal 3 homolog isoform X2 n=1 Tax=Lingula anatina TaxID=7574 RepID=A0A1S3HJF1_LINAN|nr:male-specific lethal 3 homolog isoform X2 [Lingula anatina]|eukprot:XP_013386248.1 male-specific lethal 3 homolog isoform X2 [Lingula anatina]